MRKLMRDRRLELGYSQEKVARKANMSRVNYGHIERGRNEPNLEQMDKIANALKVKAEVKFFKNYCDKTEQGNGDEVIACGS